MLCRKPDPFSPSAHFSPSHIRRIFRSIVAEPLQACVKRLRLERAIQHIRYGLAARQQAFERPRGAESN